MARPHHSHQWREDVQEAEMKDWLAGKEGNRNRMQHISLRISFGRTPQIQVIGTCRIVRNALMLARSDGRACLQKAEL
jgi:hypothetical protein